MLPFSRKIYLHPLIFLMIFFELKSRPFIFSLYTFYLYFSLFSFYPLLMVAARVNFDLSLIFFVKSHRLIFSRKNIFVATYFRDGSKFIGYTGRDERQGEGVFERLFFRKKTRGQRRFYYSILKIKIQG